MATSILTSKVASGHSAVVEMALVVDGVSHRIGQLGPDFLILERPFLCGPKRAEIITTIDGEEDRWEVMLPEGISIDERRVRLGGNLD